MKVDIKIPNVTLGDWTVEGFEVPEGDMSQAIARAMGRRWVPAGKYVGLKRNGVMVMSNTPDEINDFMPFVNKAHGDILINGLGLGCVVKALLEECSVDSITIIEKSLDVIAITSPSFNDPRIQIVHADGLEYTPPRGARYDAVWHDIWDYITADNLKEMDLFHKKYKSRLKLGGFQMSWCRPECLKLARRGSW